MARSDTQVNFRIPEATLARLRASAEASGRTLTAEINYHLDRLAPVSAETQLKIRLPADLHNSVKEAAYENERSISAEITHRLAATFKRK